MPILYIFLSGHIKTKYFGVERRFRQFFCWFFVRRLKKVCHIIIIFTVQPNKPVAGDWTDEALLFDDICRMDDAWYGRRQQRLSDDNRWLVRFSWLTIDKHGDIISVVNGSRGPQVRWINARMNGWEVCARSLYRPVRFIRHCGTYSNQCYVCLCT